MGALAPGLLVAGLLFASGLIKLRATARVGRGIHVPSLLEILAAMVVLVLTVSGATSAGGALVILGGGLMVMVASCLHLVVALRRRNELRTRSEGRRLEAYVRYLSGHDEGAS